MALNIREVEAFRAIMVAGSVTAASRLLHISQPAVSRLLINLEHNLGFALFERRLGRLCPTSEGVAFYDEVRRAFVGLQKLGETANNIRTLKHAQIRIATLSAFSPSLLPAVINRFNKRHPGVTFFVQVENPTRIREWVANQQCDLGLVSFPVANPALRAEAIVSTSLVCLLPTGHKLSKVPCIELNDLAGEPLILISRDFFLRHELEREFDRLGISPDIRAETTTTIGASGLVSQGIGIAITEPFTLALIRMPGVTMRPFSDEFRFNFGLVTPEARTPSRATSEFIGCLRQYLSENTFPKELGIDLRVTSSSPP